ncbi:MAG: dihydrofolate reductase [Rhizobiaceae bacterium]
MTLVVAVAENGVIGKEGGLPWHLSSDLKRFKADTMGKPIIMGRKTYLSIGKPLPGRENIVVTRDSAFKPDGVIVAATLDEALDKAGEAASRMGAADIAVIGGGEIYRQLFERADRLILTQVFAAPQGDTLFPPVRAGEWDAVASQDYPMGERDSHATRRVVYERRR